MAEDAKGGIENVSRAKPEDVREQYQPQRKDLLEAYGETKPEFRAKEWSQSVRLGLNRLPDKWTELMDMQTADTGSAGSTV